MFWASFYFFDAVQSAQFVDQQVVHVKTDCHRLCPQSNAVLTPLGRVKLMWPRPRSLPPVKPNKGSLREKSPDRLPLPSASYPGHLWFSDCRPFFAAAKLLSIKVSSRRSTCARLVTTSGLLPNDVIGINTLMG